MLTDIGMPYADAVAAIATGLGGISSEKRFTEAYNELVELATQYAIQRKELDKKIEEMKKRGEIVDD